MDKYIPASIETPEQLKHYRHAEAQRRYQILKRLVKRHANGCNSYNPELPARRNLWQRLLRNVMPATLIIVNRKMLSPPLNRPFSNTILAPFSLRKRKFVAQFGEEAFFGFYLPQHKLRGAEYLPGLAVEYAQLEKHEHLVKEKGGGKAAQAQ
ncbi:hypothetical protein B0H14DRAFT_3467842 [Mycena olivaceomarginata]|nr:hypothetical protein B0H14DRAFT_3467842 [Mycena olivaceomarginata]